MPAHLSRFRRRALAILLLLVAALAALHLRYPLPYVYRVFAYRDADFEDIHRFPASPIAVAGSPSSLPEAVDSRVARLVEEHPAIADLEEFLEETESTAFLVVHRGQLVEERYLRGHDRNSMQHTFSVSKSVLSAVAGAALRDGVVELEAPITRYLPELTRRNERFSQVSVEHLLDMQSGVRYEDGVGFPFVNADDALIYYYPDLESLVLERTSIASPPGTFQYNNYNPTLLGLILRRARGMSVAESLEREIWRPLGAERAAGWMADDNGFERMESGFHATGRDLARFGLLYLHGGLVDGRRVLPQAWVRQSTDFAKPVELDRYDGRSWGYRAGWWIVPRATGPSDFSAIGRFGQFIYVSPQFDAVFVRTGPGRGDWGDRDWTELFYSLAERL